MNMPQPLSFSASSQQSTTAGDATVTIRNIAGGMLTRSQAQNLPPYGMNFALIQASDPLWGMDLHAGNWQTIQLHNIDDTQQSRNQYFQALPNPNGSGTCMLIDNNYSPGTVYYLTTDGTANNNVIATTTQPPWTIINVWSYNTSTHQLVNGTGLVLQSNGQYQRLNITSSDPGNPSQQWVFRPVTPLDPKSVWTNVQVSLITDDPANFTSLPASPFEISIPNPAAVPIIQPYSFPVTLSAGVSSAVLQIVVSGPDGQIPVAQNVNVTVIPRT